MAGTPIPEPSAGGGCESERQFRHRARQRRRPGPLHVVAHAIGSIAALITVGIIAMELLPRLQRRAWRGIYVDLLVLSCATVLAYFLTWIHARVGGTVLVAVGVLTLLDEHFLHGGIDRLAILVAPMVLSGVLLLLDGARRSRRGE